MQLAELIGRRAIHALALGVIAVLAAPQILPGAGLGAALAQTSAPAAQPAQSNITVTGNRRIEVATILSYMQLPRDRAVTAEDLNLAQRRLARTRTALDILGKAHALLEDITESADTEQPRSTS